MVIVKLGSTAYISSMAMATSRLVPPYRKPLKDAAIRVKRYGNTVPPSAGGIKFLICPISTALRNNGRVDRILLAIVLLALLGKGTDAVIGLVEKRLLRRF